VAVRDAGDLEAVGIGSPDHFCAGASGRDGRTTQTRLAYLGAAMARSLRGTDDGRLADRPSAGRSRCAGGVVATALVSVSLFRSCKRLRTVGCRRGDVVWQQQQSMLREFFDFTGLRANHRRRISIWRSRWEPPGVRGIVCRQL
jgi:hypothetical protein